MEAMAYREMLSDFHLWTFSKLIDVRRPETGLRPSVARTITTQPISTRCVPMPNWWLLTTKPVRIPASNPQQQADRSILQCYSLHRRIRLDSEIYPLWPLRLSHPRRLRHCRFLSSIALVSLDLLLTQLGPIWKAKAPDSSRYSRLC